MIWFTIPQIIEQHKFKLVISGHFPPLCPKKLQKSKFWKMKKFAGGTIILHMCTKNHNRDVWFLRYGVRQTNFFLSFWAIFSPFTSPLMILNIKILKKNEKKCLEILSFYTYMCTMNEDHMLYGSWNIRRNSFQPLDNLENQNFN